MEDSLFLQAPYRTVRCVLKNYSEFNQEVSDELDGLKKSLGQTKVSLNALLNYLEYLDHRPFPVAKMTGTEAIRWMRDYLRERKNEWSDCFIVLKEEGRVWRYGWNKEKHQGYIEHNFFPPTD